MQIPHTKSKRQSLLPLSWQLFLKRKNIQLRGTLWFSAGMTLYLSLLSYAPLDPSWNTIDIQGSGHIHNWLGWYGAVAADLLLQGFGAASWIVGLPFMVWGWFLMRLANIPSRSFLLTMLALSVCCLSGSMAFLSSEVTLVGHTIVHISKWFSLSANTYFIVMGVCLGAIGTIFYISSLALTWQQWQSLGMGLKNVLTFITNRLHQSARPNLVQKASPSRSVEMRNKVTAQRLAPDFGDTKPTSVYTSHEPSIEVTETQRPVIQEIDEEEHEVYQAPIRAFSHSDFHLPKADILSDVPKEKTLSYSKTELEERSLLLKKVLDDFGVRGDIVSVRPGPVVTLYELVPAPGIKSSRIISLADDIARSMSAISARVSVIPGRNAIGIELPNEARQTVYFKDLVLDERYAQNPHRLPLILGKDISGAPIIADLARMPHLLVAGTTGSGKSVGINAMILSLVYKLSPQACKFIMIDPKMLELSIYDGIPHLLTPVVTDPRKAVVALKWVVREMENRYRAMSQLSVRNIDGYNEKLVEAKSRGEALKRTVQVGFDNETGRPQYEEQELPSEPLPYIVVVVDEMADLMLVAGKDVEGAIQRLAQMARAAGIHLIMATQRPSVDVITGTIKANFPTRISFQVTSKIDSRTILGEGGAEQLLGQGDMLYMAAGGRMIRVHGPFIKDQDVESVVKFLRSQGSPSYISTVVDESEVGGFDTGADAASSEDDLFQQAVDLVQRERKASTSFIQRYLKIGYNRAASIMDEMERRGLVSEANHVGKREVLIPSREAS